MKVSPSAIVSFSPAARGADAVASFDNHQIADQPSDLAFPQLEDIAHRQVQECAVLALRSHRALCHDDIVFFRQAGDDDLGIPDKALALDVLVELLLASNVKCAWDIPLDVISEAGEDLRMVAFSEPVHVPIDRSFVGCQTALTFLPPSGFQCPPDFIEKLCRFVRTLEVTLLDGARRLSRSLSDSPEFGPIGNDPQG